MQNARAYGPNDQFWTFTTYDKKRLAAEKLRITNLAIKDATKGSLKALEGDATKAIKQYYETAFDYRYAEVGNVDDKYSAQMVGDGSLHLLFNNVVTYLSRSLLLRILNHRMVGD